MLTDFHHHLWTPTFRRALELRSEPPCLRGSTLLLPLGGVFEVDPHAYSVEARLAELDRSGLDRAVVSLPPSTEPTRELAQLWNEEAATLERDTGGRLVPLAYAAVPDGFAGAIVPAPALADLEAMAALFDALQARGRFVFVHPAGTEPAPGAPWRGGGVGYAVQMLDAFAAWLDGGAGRWPELRVVFALLGGGAPFQLERLIRRGLDPRAPFGGNVWFDTSSYGERALELSLQTFGAGRLVFGSDAPIDRIAEAHGVVRRFGDALEQQLLEATPAALLRQERHAWAA